MPHSRKVNFGNDDETQPAPLTPLLSSGSLQGGVHEGLVHQARHFSRRQELLLHRRRGPWGSNLACVPVWVEAMGVRGAMSAMGAMAAPSLQ